MKTPTAAHNSPDAHVYDRVAVERFLNGREPVGRELTWSERRAVFRLLHQTGHGYTRICERLNISGSTFSRWARELGLDVPER